MSGSSWPDGPVDAAAGRSAGQRTWLPDARFGRYLALGLLAINLVVAAAVITVLDDWRHSEEQKFRTRAATRVRLIGSEIGNQYGRIDLALRAVAEEHGEQLAHGAQSLARWLDRIGQRHPAVSFMSVSDISGRITHSPGVNAHGSVDISDRDYFIRLRDDAQPGLQISPPLTGRISGRTVLAMARRLGELGAPFSGVVVASVPVDYLTSTLSGLVAGSDGYLGLLDGDLRWITAVPALPSGEKAGKALTVETLRAAVARAPAQGALISGENGAEQLFSYTRDTRYGFYVVTGQPVAGQLAEWRQKVLAGGLAMAVFALLTGLLGWLLSRSWRQQSATTASLLEREEWVRQAQQAGRLALFTFDLASRRFAVSEALYAITGAGVDHPHTWPGWLELVYPDDRETLDRAFRRLVAGESDVPGVEYRIVRRDDASLRWLKCIAHRVAAGDVGKPVISGVVVDVTAQKRDEDALRTSEQLFRGIFENSSIGIATTTVDRRWLEVNQAQCDLLGYDREALLATDWLDLTHPDDRAANLAARARVVAGESDGYELESRYIRGDGTIIDALVSSRALRRADRSIEYFVSLVQDITPRKRAEARLRQSEAELRATFEQAALGIALVALDGTWMSVNQRLCEMLAYRREQLVGRHFHEITHPDDLAECLELLARLLAGESERYCQEKRYVRSDGSAVWVNVTVSLICNDDGSPQHFVGIIEDIDVRRQAEREVRRSREFLRSFLDHLPGMAYVKDSSLRVVLASRGFHDLLDLDPERLVGRSNQENFPGAFGEKISAEDRRVLASGVTEEIVEDYAGRVFQTIKFVIPQDDGPTLLGGISLDVTRRHRLEQRTRALLEISQLAGTLAEPAFLAHSLELAERLTGSAIGFLHFVNDDQETIELSTWSSATLEHCTALFDTHYPLSAAGIWADCCRQKRAVMVNDYGAQADGHGLPAGHAPLQRLLSVPMICGGLVRMILGVGNKAASYDEVDLETAQLIGNAIWTIVQRARSEKALATRLAEVTELNGKLEEAHLQLLQSEKMSAIGQLAAGVAHELNNPIGFVSSNLGTLGEYVDDLLAIDAAYCRGADSAPVPVDAGALDEVRRLKAACDHAGLVDDLPKLIRESREGLERVQKIVRDLRDFSRVGESEWQWADLEKGLESTINIVWNELKYKATVERQYSPLPPVRCLASQLNQVFMNLLVNAAQAIEGSGTIVIRTGTNDEGGDAPASVWVEIEDSGRGMSTEVKKRLFEPFFTTKDVGKGTGLGLSISFGIVQKHHGRIDFRSEPGRGTTFRVTLPIDGGDDPPVKA